jgi:hypothetical protein
MKNSKSGLSLLACALAAPALASGAVIHVANNGVDTGTCGTYSSPCRSITHAMFLAASGDTVLVRPGRYGDLNRDGLLGGPGEEFPANAAVTITKPLRVISTDGAAATVIDGGNGASLFGVVWIYSSNVIFGEPGAGFLLTGAESGLQTQPVTGVRIAGNLVAGVRIHGFTVTTNGFMDVNNNVAHGLPGAGFIISSLQESQRVHLHHNQAYNNGQGILSATRGRHEVAYNDVTNNLGTGIAVDFAPSFIHHNSVSGNDIGIASNSWSLEFPPSAGPLLYRNSLLGNQRFGIMLTPGPGLPVRTTVKENNFIGNALGIPPEFFGPNCGLANFTGQTLNAANSYWGAATGPGPDPADVACGNDPVTTTPFAKSPN